MNTFIDSNSETFFINQKERLLAWSLVSLLMLAGWSTPLIAGQIRQAYECKAITNTDLSEDGRLVDGDMFWKENFVFSVDLTRGVVFFKDGVSWNMNVLQRGSSVDDAVLGYSDDVARTPVDDFIRIRDWKSKSQPVFFYVGLTKVISGTCKRIR